MSEAQLRARIALLDTLRARGYNFITPTPATHARVIARRTQARDLRDALGWSLPFARDLFDAELLDALNAAAVLDERGDLLASRVRVSSLGNDLFLHSAYPTQAADSVFFGPDSYRFASFLSAELPRLGPIKRLVDLGAGSGVGVVAAMRSTQVELITGVDVNASAFELALANVGHAMHSNPPPNASFGIDTEFVHSNGLATVRGAIDCVIANPPYIADPLHRAYRDGGAMHGAALALDWTGQAAEKLSTGGALLLYTGSAIINGEDRFQAALFETLRGFDVSYREIDPDVFGEELERADYAEVERIAVVGCVAVKR